MSSISLLLSELLCWPYSRPQPPAKNVYTQLKKTPPHTPRYILGLGAGVGVEDGGGGDVQFSDFTETMNQRRPSNLLQFKLPVTSMHSTTQDGLSHLP